ncbi:MAG: hypothetical protein GKS06_19815 [Acidobacteria bacterium]|nr:hypothetical protein [Acidobacteriota bacterium]
MTSRLSKILMSALALMLWTSAADAQGTRADYARAEQFLAPTVNSLVLNERPEPHWIKQTERFWYVRQLADGKEFLLVDAANGSRQPVFDHARMASAIAAATNASADGNDLPFDAIEFIKDEAAIRVEVGDVYYDCDLAGYSCSPTQWPASPQVEGGEVLSPDERWIAYQWDHNLWIRSTTTGENFPLTSNGRYEYDYSRGIASTRNMVPAEDPNLQMGVAAIWSPDSRRILLVPTRSPRRTDVFSNTVGSRRPVPADYLHVPVCTSRRGRDRPRRTGDLRRLCPHVGGSTDRPDQSALLLRPALFLVRGFGSSLLFTRDAGIRHR